MYVQSLQMPFEVFAVNNFYGVILHAQPSAQNAMVRDNITNEIFNAPISEFIGTIPHKPK